MQRHREKSKENVYLLDLVTTMPAACSIALFNLLAVVVFIVLLAFQPTRAKEIHVCEGDTARMAFIYNITDYDSITSVYIEKTSPNRTDIIFQNRHQKAMPYEKRASLLWTDDLKKGQFVFRIESCTMSDAGTYATFVYMKGSVEENSAIIIIIKSSACPDLGMMRRPVIAYRQSTFHFIAVHNQTLGLVIPGNFTLRTRLPGAEPPVECVISTGLNEHNCTGIPGNTSECNIDIGLLSVPDQVINVVMRFVAYPAWTTKLYINTKEVGGHGEILVSTTSSQPDEDASLVPKETLSEDTSRRTIIMIIVLVAVSVAVVIFLIFVIRRQKRAKVVIKIHRKDETSIEMEPLTDNKTVDNPCPTPASEDVIRLLDEIKPEKDDTQSVEGLKTSMKHQIPKTESVLVAASYGHLNELRRLSKDKRDLSLANYDGRTALHVAAATGHLDCVKFLLDEWHVPLEVIDRWGHAPIDDACNFSKNDVLDYLTELYKQRGLFTNVSTERSMCGDQQVDFKHINNAAKGNLAALKSDWKAGEDLSTPDYDSRTALHLAAAEGQLECVKFLWETCKVQYDRKDRWGNAPIDDACKFHRTDVREYLEDIYKQNGTQFQQMLDTGPDLTHIAAADKGDLAELKRLRELGNDISSGGYDGITALHRAAARGHLECVKFLLKECKNLRPDTVDRYGCMPLTEAKTNNHEAVVEHLQNVLQGCHSPGVKEHDNGMRALFSSEPSCTYY